MIRANALKQGFATAQTNTGHDATAEPVASFAMSYQKRVDYAFRAVHMTGGRGQADHCRLLRARGRLSPTGTAARPAAARA